MADQKATTTTPVPETDADHTNPVGVFRGGHFVVVPTDRPVPSQRVLKPIPETSALAYVTRFAAQRQTKDA